MVSKVVVSGACLGLGLACLLTSRRASAWEALQLTLNATAFSYQKTTLTIDAQPNLQQEPITFKTSTTGVGFIGEGFGAGIGYAWNNILLGARAEVWSSTTSQDTGGTRTDTSTLALLPRFEYIFEPGRTSPYLAAILGVEHTSTTSAAVAELGGQSSQSGTEYLYGAAFGVHGFIVPAVSVDPELAVMGAAGSVNLTSSGAPDENASQSELRVLLTVGLSAWLGARPAEPAADVSEPEASLLPAPPLPKAPEPDPDADEVKPLFTNIHLPGHRRLYVQASKDPAHTALIIRLSGARNEVALAVCNDISVPDATGALKMRVQSHGDHFVAGVIAPHAV